MAAALRYAGVAAAFIGLNAGAAVTHLNLASASLVNLLLVQVAARRFGLAEATLGSVVAVMCLNYLFVPPVYTFTVADPQNWIALAAFEASALIVSRLSGRAAQQMRIAQQERNDSERLYEAGRQILLLDGQRPAGPQMVQLIQRVFDPELVALFDAGAARMDGTPEVPDAADRLARGACYQDRDFHDDATGTWYRVLRSGVRPTGALALKGGNITAHVAGGLASLAAIGLERVRLFESESRAAAGRHAEQLRAAVLDALGHEFKTPLTAIRAASTGLLELEPLSPVQRELAALVEEQSLRLSNLTSRLLATARLDAAEIVPRRQPLALGELVALLLDAAGDRTGGREVMVELNNEEAATPADGDLMTMAVLQVMDNALKYSDAGTPIRIRGWASDAEVCLSIRNQGPGIPPADRERIFERYFRAASIAHRAPGTGLGLHVTRRIVEAHRGRVWVESSATTTVFTIALPRQREAR